MTPTELRLFALTGSESQARAVAKLLETPLAKHEERDFEDGEHKIRPLEPVAGADVYVLYSLHGDGPHSANDKLCRLLFFVGALKDGGAARVTVVAPYLCYARKDRRTKPGDPVTTRYLAALFEAVGADAVVAVEVHNETAFENAFRLRTLALSATPLLIEAIAGRLGEQPLVVVSPDLGGGKRAEIFRQALENRLGRPVGKAFAEKHRSGGLVTGDLFAGDVAGALCLVVDDLISTGGTVLRAAQAARNRGARAVWACVAHGLFMPGAEALFADPALDRILVTDTVPPGRLPQSVTQAKLEVVPAAPLLADVIRRLHWNEPFTGVV